jgi:hypothetical protein
MYETKLNRALICHIALTQIVLVHCCEAELVHLCSTLVTNRSLITQFSRMNTHELVKRPTITVPVQYYTVAHGNAPLARPCPRDRSTEVAFSPL